MYNREQKLRIPDDTPAQLTRSTRFDNFFEFPYLCGDILAWVNFLSTGQLGEKNKSRQITLKFTPLERPLKTKHFSYKNHILEVNCSKVISVLIWSRDLLDLV